MDLWLNIALPDLLKLLKRVDGIVVNDSEARQLTKENNLFRAAEKLHRLGPSCVIIKKGEHGAVLSSRSGLFVAPAFPLRQVVDPTGAGDSFVGGMMGYLSSAKGPVEGNLRRAIIYGSVVASYCCEGFGVTATNRLSRADIEKRVRALEKATQF
jgi:sugar/nucleoside kinase (ribokinase family)